MNLKFALSGQDLTYIGGKKLVADTILYIGAELDVRTTDWDGYDIWLTVQYEDGEPYEPLHFAIADLENPRIRIIEPSPNNALNLIDGHYTMWVHGSKLIGEDDDQHTSVITSDSIALDVLCYGGNGSMEPPSITVTAFDQLSARMSAVEEEERRVVEAEARRVIAEESRVNAESERVVAENARQTAESARATAETARSNAETARASAEESRAEAETDRASAETERETAESERVSAESSRASAEEDRATAESSRTSAEANRVSAESTRASSESLRVTAESARTTAETNRATAESVRATAETARSNAETARANAEESRAEAETDRASAETERATAESARATAEANRVTAETSRASAESSRATAESERSSAETSRATAETNRATSETNRATAEASRVTAESARDIAETAREAAEASRQANEIRTVTASVDNTVGTPSINVTKAGNNLNLAFSHMKGEQGETGATGNGIASAVLNADYTLTLTFTDGTTYTTPSIRGAQGLTGNDGQDGSDGFSPIITITEITGGHSVEITDAEHTDDFDVMDGADGENGQDGISPTVTVTTIAGGHEVTITDAEGDHTFDVMDGAGSGDMMSSIYDANSAVASAGGIASYVDANGGKIDHIKVNNTEQTIINKTVDITVPTSLSALTDDSGHRLVTDTEKSAWNAKGDMQASVYDPANGAKQVAFDEDVVDIEGKIPSQASSSNQLADKNFVNSSIENVAAYYITKDAAGNSFATKAELNSATTFYSGGAVRVPTRNDYCVVLADESKTITETGENPTTRYIYDNNTWSYQYIVNRSGLTAAQWATVNSGLTAGMLPSGVSSTDKLVKSSSLSTVATSGSYNDLTNKPTIPSAVTESTVSGWGFTKNTGTYSKPSGGIPKADLASAVQTSLGLADSALQSVPSTYRTSSAQDIIDAGKVDTTDFEQFQQSVESSLADKVDISAQAPKTSSMTQEVGIDENGKLWISPSPLRYGFRRKKAESNPSARIEYLYDAVEMAPAYMDYANGEFVWGDWKAFVEQVARPVMLKADGTVGYELDHDDQTKKLDGTSSDIANTAYNGNAMVEFGKFKWVKRYEDATYEYVIFSNTKFDNEYHAYAHTGADGQVKDAFCYGMYPSQKIGAALRSFGTNNSSVTQTAEAEITQSKANGSGYNIHDHMKWSYILDLLVLIGKSDNLQATYGEGNSNTSAQIENGTLKDKGAFFGYNTTASAVKVLWIENLWGNIWQRMHGLICDNGTYKTKAHAPFCDTPVSAADYSAYRNTGITAPAGGYVKDAYNTDLDAYLPKTVGGSASTYFCEYFHISAAIIAFARVGGDWSNGGKCGRYVSLAYAASIANGGIGSRLSYTP